MKIIFKNWFKKSILKESEKYPTTTHFLYKIMGESKGRFNDVNKLEKIITSIENNYPKKEDYSKEEVISILESTKNKLKDLGLIYFEEFDCDDFSFINYAIGEAMNLPLNLVMAPKHAFIRYDKKGEQFNWETVHSEIISDEEYTKRLNIHEDSISQGSYLRSLSKIEVIGLAFMNRGLDFYKQNNNNEAFENLNKASILNSSCPEIFYNKGKILFNKMKYKESLKNFKKAFKLNPNFSQAIEMIGLYFYHQKKYNQALENYERLINLNPTETDYFYNQGVILQELEKYDEALEKYAHAIGINPNFSEAYNNQGIIFALQKRYSEANTCFEKAIEINPKNIITLKIKEKLI